METRITPVEPRLEYACEHCGQLTVTREAWAEWNSAAQAWAINMLFDFAFCHHCHRATRLVERPVGGG